MANSNIRGLFWKTTILCVRKGIIEQVSTSIFQGDRLFSLLYVPRRASTRIYRSYHPYG